MTTTFLLWRQRRPSARLGFDAEAPGEEVGPDRVDLAVEASRSPPLSTTWVATSRRSSSVGLRGHPPLGVVARDTPGLEPVEADVERRLDHDHRPRSRRQPAACSRRAGARRTRRRRRPAPVDPALELLADRRPGDLVERLRPSSSAKARSARAGRSSGRRRRGCRRRSARPGRRAPATRLHHRPRDLVGVDDHGAPRSAGASATVDFPTRSRP